MALGVRVASRWCLLLLEVATSYTAWWLVTLSKHAMILCGAPEKRIVRGTVLTPRGSRRATLVERDVKATRGPVGSSARAYG